MRPRLSSSARRLDLALIFRRDMLQRATAALTEDGATRLDARGSRVNYLEKLRLIEIPASLPAHETNRFSLQCTRDEDLFARHRSDSAAIMGHGFDQRRFRLT